MTDHLALNVFWRHGSTCCSHVLKQEKISKHSHRKAGVTRPDELWALGSPTITTRRISGIAAGLQVQPSTSLAAQLVTSWNKVKRWTSPCPLPWYLGWELLTHGLGLQHEVESLLHSNSCRLPLLSSEDCCQEQFIRDSSTTLQKGLRSPEDVHEVPLPIDKSYVIRH